MIIALGMMLPAATVLGGSVVSNYSSKGATANALFFSVDPTDCIFTEVYVSAIDGQVKVSGSSRTLSSTVDVFVSIYDVCTGAQILGAYGFKELAADDFTVSMLSTASLVTSIDVQDYISGSTFTLDVDIDWVGDGDTIRSKSRSSFTSGGFRFTDRFDGTFRQAIATGSVLLGTQNLVPDPGFGSIANVKFATKTVEKL